MLVGRREFLHLTREQGRSDLFEGWNEMREDGRQEGSEVILIQDSVPSSCTGNTRSVLCPTCPSRACEEGNHSHQQMWFLSRSTKIPPIPKPERAEYEHWSLKDDRQAVARPK